MFNLRQLFVVALAASSAWAATYADVLNDLKTTDTDIKTVTSQLNAYTGTGAQTLNLRTAVKKVIADVQKAISDTDASPTPTAAQGQTILDYINSPLLPDTKAALTASKNKKAVFTSAGTKTEFLGYLKQLKDLVDSLADKLIAKAPTSALKSGGQTAKNNYDAAFNDAINYISA